MVKLSGSCVRVVVGVILVILFASSGNASVVSFAWDPPAKNVDGSPLTDLAGYKLYFGSASRDYTNCMDLGDMTSFTVSNLTSGVTYYFSVRSYNSAGVESDFSEELSWRDMQGLPDGWEIWETALFGQEASPGEDCDGDGYSNLEEYISGNNPTNLFCNSSLMFSVANGARQLQFVVFAADGPAYDGLQRYSALHKTTDLTRANWTPVSGYERILGTGQTVYYAPQDTAMGPCYFRLVTWLE